MPLSERNKTRIRRSNRINKVRPAASSRIARILPILPVCVHAKDIRTLHVKGHCVTSGFASLITYSGWSLVQSVKLGVFRAWPKQAPSQWDNSLFKTINGKRGLIVHAVNNRWDPEVKCVLDKKIINLVRWNKESLSLLSFSLPLSLSRSQWRMLASLLHVQMEQRVKKTRQASVVHVQMAGPDPPVHWVQTHAYRLSYT